jgi:hypothetical protein
MATIEWGKFSRAMRSAISYRESAATIGGWLHLPRKPISLGNRRVFHVQHGVWAGPPEFAHESPESRSKRKAQRTGNILSCAINPPRIFIRRGQTSQILAQEKARMRRKREVLGGCST